MIACVPNQVRDDPAVQGLSVAMKQLLECGVGLEHAAFGVGECDTDRRILKDRSETLLTGPQRGSALEHLPLQRVGVDVHHLERRGQPLALAAQPLDLACLIDRPLQLITSLNIDDVARDTLAAIGAFLRERITELAHRGLDRGACHGDLTFDNVHITASGETVWYDFDSGGPGWRAIDLQGWALASPERRADWRAFLDGYRSVRPLGDHDIATAPYMWLARVFWGIGVDLERRVLGEGEERMRAWLTARCAALTEAIRTMEQRSPPRHWGRRPTA